MCVLQLSREVLAGIIIVPRFLPEMCGVAWHLGLVLCPIYHVSLALDRDKLNQTSFMPPKVIEVHWAAMRNAPRGCSVADHEATRTCASSLKTMRPLQKCLICETEIEMEKDVRQYIPSTGKSSNSSSSSRAGVAFWSFCGAWACSAGFCAGVCVDAMMPSISVRLW